MKFRQILILIVICTLCACNSALKEGRLAIEASEALKKKQWKEAKEIYTELIRISPNNPDYYFHRSLALSHIDRLSTINQQIKDLKRAIEIDSTMVEAEFFLFLAYMFSNEFDKGIATIDNIITKRGELPFLLSWKANCAFAGKDFKIAESNYKKRLQFSGNKDELRSIYYYWIFSKYFGGNKEGALWDCAFLPDRGFEENLELLEQISSDKLVWEEVSNFYIPEWSIEQIRSNLEIENNDVESEA